MEKEFSESGPEGLDQTKGQDIARLREMTMDIYNRRRFDFYEAMVRKVKELQAAYPDYQDYRLYHLLIGSTPLGECPKYDFPGDDSIERFLTEQEQTFPAKDHN